MDTDMYTRVRVKSLQFLDTTACVSRAATDGSSDALVTRLQNSAHKRGYILHDDPAKSPVELQNLFQKFHDKQQSQTHSAVNDDTAVDASTKVYVPPMEIIASMDGPGLGLLDWWH
uniref:Pejvakin n=1 Tax=Lygus hesperus TaxID=30085 RepID=A0A0A9YFF4_LYGHE